MSETSPSATKATTLGSDIIRSTGIYSLALIAPKLASLLLLPIYTRQLAPADYAVMDLIDQACNLLAMLLGANLTAGLCFYFFQHDDDPWRRKAASTNILGCFLTGVCFGVLGFAVAVPLSELVFKTAEYATYFRMMFVTMGASFGLEAILNWIKADNRPELYTGVSLVRLALVVCFSVTFLVWLRLGIGGVLLSNLLVTVFLAIALGIYTVRSVGWALDWSLLWAMAKFSVPVALGGLAIFVVNFADRFILQRNVSMAELGQYSVAYKIGMLMAFVHGSFHTFWTSRAYDILKRPDREQIFSRLFTYLIGLLSIAALGLIVFTKPALVLLATKQYSDAAVVVPVIVLAYYIRAAGDFLRILFAVHEQLKWDAACNWLGGVACFILYLWWIPKYGMWGAASATLAAFALVLTVVFLKVRTLMPFRLEFGRLARLAGFMMALGYIAIALLPANLMVQVAGGVGLTLLYPLLLWSSGFFTAAELQTGRQYLAIARRRIRPA